MRNQAGVVGATILGVVIMVVTVGPSSAVPQSDGVPVPARISFDHDLERLESKNKHNCEGKHRKEEYNKKLILQEGMYGVSI